jgi:hypothetical protein
LGFHILAGLSSGHKVIAEVDRFIETEGKASRLHPWEVLWFLTCLNHDPGYTAEKFWANFRFAFGIVEDASDEEEIPDQVKEQIRDLWGEQICGPQGRICTTFTTAPSESGLRPLSPRKAQICSMKRSGEPILTEE